MVLKKLTVMYIQKGLTFSYTALLDIHHML